MSIRIKIFGQLAEIVGSIDMEWKELPDTDSVRKQIIADFPKLEHYPFVLSVNNKIVNLNQKINKDDEVALLPPFAGG